MPGQDGRDGEASRAIIPGVSRDSGGRICSYEDAWEAARTAAGLPNRQVRDFRRSAVRNLTRAGVSHPSAMAMVGHQTEAMYRRYCIADEADLKEGGEKLARLLAFERGQVRKIVPVGGNR